MQVILKTDVPSLGKIGDVKDVSTGYARNYLIPKGLVLMATPTTMKWCNQEKKRQERKLQQETTKAQLVAKRIEKVSCTMPVKTGEEGKIFGAVTNQDIADSLRTKGIIIDKRAILLEQEIHHTGGYVVDVRISPQVVAKLKVWVVAEEKAAEENNQNTEQK